MGMNALTLQGKYSVLQFEGCRVRFYSACQCFVGLVCELLAVNDFTLQGCLLCYGRFSSACECFLDGVSELLTARKKGLKYPLLIKRLACMVISGMASADSLDILQPANYGILSKGGEEFELLIFTLKNSGIHPELLTFLTKEWYFSMLARIRVNVFRIEMIDGTGYHADLLAAASASISAESAVGNAVYMLSSMYNHDCDPNTHILWVENAKASLKALRNIEAGEELRICYIDASLDHEARQSVLYQSFGFWCKCFRCKSED
ncbi:histone-lysine N-methyltransferase ATXR4 [Cryptomeria japonica]|uniref:histone-lysine N-methyltransferase ATXR4 n=1 Tax=Cryptomeria japonica TaxID=3369 RepID=UPI0027DA29C4|nr:histone-lysine N-methyltransferase ATXR4 [Cryptomeria japonica]